MNYTVKGQDGTAEVNLVFTKRETKKGIKVHPFITSLDIGPEKISKLFGWRWRIEMNNRELEKFRALTTSPCMKIRRIYFALSMILYNFWIVRGEGATEGVRVQRDPRKNANLKFCGKSG